MEFFRQCPKCGRRFHVMLVSKKPLSLERESEWAPYGGISGGEMGRGPLDRATGKPIVLDVEEVQYDYRCKSCGHEWSEKSTGTHKEG